MSTEHHADFVWPTEGLSYGGDYNPEQWPREVWAEDIALMREAKVNIVSLGIFSWGLLETSEGTYDWDWFDDVIELLSSNGIAVDLATPSAAPPAWLLHAHPEVLAVDVQGRRMSPGARVNWCPSNLLFRSYAVSMASALARRYGAHPAVRLWHVSNELGGGQERCYCDVSAQAFRGWVAARYGTIDALNEAWGTAFWGHRFGSFEQVYLPRGGQMGLSPSLVLDFERFSSEEWLAHYLAEKAAIQEHSRVPVTTNLMVNTRDVVDYPRWAPHLAVVANDHYIVGNDPRSQEDLAFSADRMRGISHARAPWFLMEHSTGAPSWQPHNRPKGPGELVRNSLAHIARGSDAALFFQWRASVAGSEQHHSAMVPHAGRHTKIWHDVVELGQHLERLKEVKGSRVAPARVALLWDTEADWAFTFGLKPTRQRRYADEATRWYGAFYRRGILVDVIPPWVDLDDYDLIIVPTLYLVSDQDAARIAEAAQRGATVVVGYFSGIVDVRNQVRLGGYPGAFKNLLGVFSEEFYPLLEGTQEVLDNGWPVRYWSESLIVQDAEVVANYASGPLATRPALTRRTVGRGAAWYVSAGLIDDHVEELVGQLVQAGGIEASAPVPEGVEAVWRQGTSHDYLFLLNHTSVDHSIGVAEGSFELLTQTQVGTEVDLPAGAVRVVRTAAEA